MKSYRFSDYLLCKVRPSLLSLFIFLFWSCNKFVDVVPPVTSTSSDIVYSDDATAIATLNNIYTFMSQQGITSGITSFSLYSGLSSDELVLFDGTSEQTYLAYFTNSLTPNNTAGSDFWINTYPTVLFSANAAIEGLTQSTKLTHVVKNQLLGEAKFLRAFFYFYLVNIYGPVPLVLNTDYKANSQIKRSSIDLVYKQIINDLIDAQNLLSEDYLNGALTGPSIERTVPNKWAATALLARVYLFIKDYKNAEIQSTSIINNKTLYDTTNVNKTFLINSPEAIWQIQSVSKTITNTSEARLFILPSSGPDRSLFKIYLNERLLEIFEPGDLRKANWIGSVVVGNKTYYYPFKYKVNAISSDVSERSMVLRIAEQYLIRSEARAQQNNISEAIDDLNIIRARSGLSKWTNAAVDAVLIQILHERQIEFFTEWGHRWLDLKRTGKVDEILRSQKGDTWQSTDQLYPIPFSEITKNIALSGDQNPGY